MNLIEKLSAIAHHFDELTVLLATPEVTGNIALMQQYAQERSDLEDVASVYKQLKLTEQRIAEAEEILNGSDTELKELAQEDLQIAKAKHDEILQRVKILLIPKDPMDDKNAIITIQGGAGGDEAALFAGELFRMYIRYATKKRWQIDILDTNETGQGGMKDATFILRGKGTYGRMKYEGGTHRVQRVPVTESNGRIHTSTAKVLVMPEVDDSINIDIKDADVRVDIFRSHGHGGQGVNTTDSAVRVTHLETGLVVTCQDERSKIQNLASAMSVLKSRLWDLREAERLAALSKSRHSQVQTGDRSEKIRTYNFPQDRVTDHRIGFSRHNLPGIMDGDLDELIDNVSAVDQADRMNTTFEEE